MANDGTVTFSVWLDADDAEKELNNIKKKILQLQTELDAQKSVKNGLEEALSRAGVAADEAKAKLEALRSSGASASAIREQESIVKGLDKEFEAAAAAVDKQNAKIRETNAALDAQQTAYGKIQQQALATAGAVKQVQDETVKAGTAGEEAGDVGSRAADALSARLDRLTSRITGLIKRVLIFSLITRALRSFRDYLGKALKTSDEFVAAIARLKGALQTAFQPILTAVIPWITALINVLTAAVSMIASLVATLFGTTVDASAASAESMNEEMDAISGVGGAAKDASKQLAAFDEINKLGGDSGAGSGGGGASANGIAADYDFNQFTDLTDKMRETEILIEGMALLIGALLTFSGVNIPLGIALMAIGAAGLAKEWPANWEYIKQMLQGKFGAIAAIGGALLLALGLVLIFAGGPKGLPLGIGMALVGGALLAATVVANWDYIKKQLQGKFGAIAAIGGTLLLALGLVLIFAGGPAALPLGLGMAIAGGALLAATAVANWDYIKEQLQGKFGAIAAIGGTLLLALGLVLIFAGGPKGLPLGIGMALIGGAALAATIIANWGSIKEKLQGDFGMIAAIGGTLLLALGLVLIFAGGPAALPLGLGLAIAGGALLAAPIAANWDLIKEKLQAAWEAIARWWKADVSPIFTAQWWTDKFHSISDGMKAALNVAIAFVERAVNWIIEKVNTIGFTVPEWIGGEMAGKHVGFNFSAVAIPRLAEGAVIPPNREFLSILGDQKSGTNIEAPLDTMVAAFRQALSDSGAGNRTVVFKIGETEFARLVFNAFSSESQRIGTPMVD